MPILKRITTELVDPLSVEKLTAKLDEKRDKLLSELDTQIKVSNATTFIEFLTSLPIVRKSQTCLPCSWGIAVIIYTIMKSDVHTEC